MQLEVTSTAGLLCIPKLAAQVGLGVLEAAAMHALLLSHPQPLSFRLARQLEWGWGVACWRASVVLRWHLEGLFPRDWSERRAYLCGAQALVLLARKLGRLLLVAADPRL